MSEPGTNEETPDFDPSTLQAEDAPPIGESRKPDHRASRERRAWGRREKTEKTSSTRPSREREQKTKPKKTLPPRRKGQFVEPLENIYATIAITLMPFDPICANAVAAAAPNCAKTLDDLAYQNEAVRRMIHGLVTTSAFGAVIAAHLPILLAVAVHHVPAAQKMSGVVAMRFAAASAERAAEEPDGDADHAAA